MGKWLFIYFEGHQIEREGGLLIKIDFVPRLNLWKKSNEVSSHFWLSSATSAGAIVGYVFAGLIGYFLLMVCIGYLCGKICPSKNRNRDIVRPTISHIDTGAQHLHFYQYLFLELSIELKNANSYHIWTIYIWIINIFFQLKTFQGDSNKCLLSILHRSMRRLGIRILDNQWQVNEIYHVITLLCAIHIFLLQSLSKQVSKQLSHFKGNFEIDIFIDIKSQWLW